MALTLAATCVTAPASAQLVADPVAARLCDPRSHDGIYEGVLTEGGRDMLLFRVAWKRDGTGCYAALNKQPAWSITDLREFQGRVGTRNGIVVWSNNHATVRIDPKARTASYEMSGRTTPGRLTK
jgi:hypothetical protein